MRYVILFAAAALAAAAWGCGGDSKAQPTAVATRAASPVASAAATSKSATASKSGTAATPGSQASPQDATDEVTGIVGSVSVSTRSIEINRLSGASITKITLDSSTVIRKAGGGTTTLGQIRPSDRIIARGHLSDRKDALIAAEITVQDVIPGAQPGG